MRTSYLPLSNTTKIILLFCIYLIAGCSGSNTLEEFQQDADIIRLRHLKYYGELLTEYQNTTGHFPFQNEHKLPVYVDVANAEQIEFTKTPLPFSHVKKTFKELIGEIETGLGRKIEEHYDPQYRPTSRPNFYIYMVRGDNYFFAVHVHQPFSFARKVSENYYKIEISNHPTQQNHAYSLSNLFNNKDFNKELEAPVSKEGFFQEREEKFLHYTKTIN